MASISELQNLADKLTETMPPPLRPLGIDRADLRDGRWVVVRAGVGMFAVRAEYTTGQNEKIMVRHDDEILGYPQSIISALRFAVRVAESHRHYWVAV